jgi:hypothetical protein
MAKAIWDEGGSNEAQTDDREAASAAGNIRENASDANASAVKEEN